MTKWEYAVMALAGTLWTAQLDEMGVRGWELVSVIATNDGLIRAFFKRKIQP